MAENGVYWVLRRQTELTDDTTSDIPFVFEIWESAIDEISASGGTNYALKTSLMASTEDDAPDHATRGTRSFAEVKAVWPLTQIPKSALQQHVPPAEIPYRRVEVVYHVQQNMAGMKFSYSMLG